MNLSPRPFRSTFAVGLSLFVGACASIAPSSARFPATPGSRTCTGACLSGLDPYDVGCATDATTSLAANARDAEGRLVATIELRSSARCQTSWARAVRAPGARGTLVAIVRAPSGSNSYEHAVDGEVWTDMVPGAQVCVTVALRTENATPEPIATSCADERVARLAEK